MRRWYSLIENFGFGCIYLWIYPISPSCQTLLKCLHTIHVLFYLAIRFNIIPSASDNFLIILIFTCWHRICVSSTFETKLSIYLGAFWSFLLLVRTTQTSKKIIKLKLLKIHVSCTEVYCIILEVESYGCFGPLRYHQCQVLKTKRSMFFHISAFLSESSFKTRPIFSSSMSTKYREWNTLTETPYSCRRSPKQLKCNIKILTHKHNDGMN